MLRFRFNQIDAFFNSLPLSLNGGRATRPPLQQHRMNVGGSPTLLSRSMAHFQAPAADALEEVRGFNVRESYILIYIYTVDGGFYR